MSGPTTTGAHIRAVMAARKEEEFARQRITVRCALCTNGRRFKFTGPVRVAQQRFVEHRACAHPDAPSLEQAQTLQRRKRRSAPVVSSGRGQTHYERREFLSAEEIREREVLRRLTRTDLPALEEEAA